MDFYFNNIWNAIEKENLNNENLSFSGTPLDKNDKNSYNMNYDFPNSNNINEIRNRDHDNKNEDLRKMENPCAGNVCADICEIF